MKKLFIITIFAISACLSLWAVPADRRPHAYVQPNGDTIIVILHGDERRHWTTTEDGVLIKQNKQQYYCYAKRKADWTIKPTCHKAHNADKRTKKECKFVEKLNLKNEL